MKILFTDILGNVKFVEMQCIPPMGSKISLGYTPLPSVSEIILFPHDELIINQCPQNSQMFDLLKKSDVWIMCK